MSPGEYLARVFHQFYEEMAPDLGYQPRPETRQFDPESANGKLMIAVCTRMFTSGIVAPGRLAWQQDQVSGKS